MDFYANLCGYAAAGATLLAFWQSEPLPLRRWAIAANIFFILYGWLGDLMPPLLLHVILLPLNLRMLTQAAGDATGRRPEPS